MNGGYASHFGVNPRYFTAQDYPGKGTQFRDRIITPLFFNEANKNTAPFYHSGCLRQTVPEVLRGNAAKRNDLAKPQAEPPTGGEA
jgi:formate C-acetyltransferase